VTRPRRYRDHGPHGRADCAVTIGGPWTDVTARPAPPRRRRGPAAGVIESVERSGDAVRDSVFSTGPPSYGLRQGERSVTAPDDGMRNPGITVDSELDGAHDCAAMDADRKDEL